MALLITLLAIWNVRSAIAALIRGSGGGHLARPLAELWPVAATAYVIAVHVARVREVVAGRVAYEKLPRAFAAQGIEFASRRVAVYVPPAAGGDGRRNAAAAAHAQEVDAAPRIPTGLRPDGHDHGGGFASIRIASYHAERSSMSASDRGLAMTAITSLGRRPLRNWRSWSTR